MVEEIIRELKTHYSEKNIEGMKRFGIVPKNAFGVSTPVLLAIAKKYKNNHELALELWEHEVREAKHLAIMIEDCKQTTDKQLEKWVSEIDSWDICDSFCSRLVRKLPDAYKKVKKWHIDDREFVRRSAFSTIAWLAVHDKKASDAAFIELLRFIEETASDERNFVKKAVNWALRQIGKRNPRLLEHAKECAQRIQQQNSKSARWIANDAIREFNNEKILNRILNKK